VIDGKLIGAKNQSKPQLAAAEFVEKVTIQDVPIAPERMIEGGELFDRLKGVDTEPVTYLVQEGDCVSCIAQKFSIPQDVIYSNNPWIQNDMITIGDELDLTVRKPKLSVKTEERYTELVYLPSGENVTYDETMRVGTSRVIHPGKQGLKNLHYQVTKVNGELIEEIVEKEELLEKPIPRQVAHLKELDADKGDLVEKGDFIGIMGNTGRSTGTHLHFEIHKDDTQVNPRKYLE